MKRYSLSKPVKAVHLYIRVLYVTIGLHGLGCYGLPCYSVSWYIKLHMYITCFYWLRSPLTKVEITNHLVSIQKLCTNRGVASESIKYLAHLLQHRLLMYCTCRSRSVCPRVMIQPS